MPPPDEVATVSYRLRTVATLLLVGVATVGTSAASCLGPKKVPDPPHDPGGTVVATRTEPNGESGATRVVATIEDAQGHRWEVRLAADTRCVKKAHYPECAG